MKYDLGVRTRSAYKAGDKAELVRRVLVKADAFTVASGLLTGQRQRMEDALEAAASVEEAQAIPVAYSLDPVAGIV